MYNEHHGIIKSQNRIMPRGRPVGGSFQNYKEEKQRGNEFAKVDEPVHTRPYYREQNIKQNNPKFSRNQYGHGFEAKNMENQNQEKYYNNFMQPQSSRANDYRVQNKERRSFHKRNQTYSNDLQVMRKQSVQLPSKSQPYYQKRVTTQDQQFERNYKNQNIYKREDTNQHFRNYDNYRQEKPRQFKKDYQYNDMRSDRYEVKSDFRNQMRGEPRNDARNYGYLPQKQLREQRMERPQRMQRNERTQRYDRIPRQERPQKIQRMQRPQRSQRTQRPFQRQERKQYYRQRQPEENYDRGYEIDHKKRQGQMEGYGRNKRQSSQSHQISPNTVKNEDYNQYDYEPSRKLSVTNLRNIQNRSYLPTQTNQQFQNPKSYNNITTPSSKKNREVDESEEKRKSLIQKSKNLKDKLVKLTENTPEKFYQNPSQNENKMGTKERIQYLKTTKDRFYESPYKNQGSRHDFEDKKNEKTEKGEDPYMKKISLFGKNIQNNTYDVQRSQKYGNTSKNMNVGKEELYSNEESGRGNKENGYDCMSRINMLNSKINERINSIIHSFGGKQ